MALARMGAMISAGVLDVNGIDILLVCAGG